MAKIANNLLGYPKEIKKIFSIISKNNPKVLEIGCGSGRDAKEILKYTNDYLGIDFSEGMIKQAKKFVPEADFIIADLEEFIFPEKLDVIFAAASLLHSDKENLKNFFNKAYDTLNKGGVIFISLRYREKYEGEKNADDFGSRFFYYYNSKLVKKIAGERYKIWLEEIEEYRNLKWINFIFQK